MQDLFESQSEFGTKEVGMLNDFTKHWEAFHHETTKTTFSLAYYKGLKVIADKYECEYTEPVYRGGLKGVDTSPTVH